MRKNNLFVKVMAALLAAMIAVPVIATTISYFLSNHVH